MTIQSIRGTHDILPGSVELWQEIESAARRLFELYGYGEIRTPIFEETELFARSIGTATDIVQKEMYTFDDRKGKRMTLRPEGTAPVVRAFIEHRLYAEGIVHKLYYIGPMFRHERPQKGRYRQFHQIGAEILGSDHPVVEAEVIEMLVRLVCELGIVGTRLLVNSVGCPRCRPAYIELLRERLVERAGELCVDCVRRTETNPLRVLDCKNEACRKVIEELPTLLEHLGPECTEHFGRFRNYLDRLGIGYEVAPRLVRGLDYYVRTTFEIVSDRLGPTQNAILGGGRYDGLSEILGGPATKGFGFALGMERLVLLISGREEIQAPYAPPPPEIFLAYVDETALAESFQLARKLRGQGISVYLDLEGRSLKAQMRLANRLNARFTCVLGPAEIERGEFRVKRMADGSEVQLGLETIAEYLLKERKNPAPD